MKIAIVILIVLLSCSNSTATESMNNLRFNDLMHDGATMIGANNKNDSTYSEGVSKPKLKNPFLALGLSIVPGFILRGSGHFYAGRKKTAIVLFALFAWSFIESANSLGDNDVAVITFSGTWLYDIIASPIVCSRMNRKAKQAYLTPYIKNNYLFRKEFGILLSYRF